MNLEFFSRTTQGLPTASETQLRIQTLRRFARHHEVSFPSLSPDMLPSTDRGAVRDTNKCLLAAAASRSAPYVQSVLAIDSRPPGKSKITTYLDGAREFGLHELRPAPSSARRVRNEVDHTAEVWKALLDPSKTVFIQTAPAIRVVSRGPRTRSGQLRNGPDGSRPAKLGFSRSSTRCYADLTIMEEGHELIERFNEGARSRGSRPLAGLDQIIGHFFRSPPHVLDLKPPSRCSEPSRRPTRRQGGNRPRNMVVVSIMPHGEEVEARRSEMTGASYTGRQNSPCSRRTVYDVDVASRRGNSEDDQQAGSRLDSCGRKFDDPWALSETAVIFVRRRRHGGGAQTAYECSPGSRCPNSNSSSSGLDGIKTADIEIKARP